MQDFILVITVLIVLSLVGPRHSLSGGLFKFFNVCPFYNTAVAVNGKVERS